MQFDRIGIELRQRSPWEAVDLALPFLRRWARPAFAAWFGVCGPIILAVLLLLWEYPYAVMFVVWWLKPLYDRILLAVYSEALFRRPPGVIELWRRLPKLLTGSGLGLALTFGRMSVQRSFHLPIRQLEGQKGPQAAAARRRLLNRTSGGCATWLTFVCGTFSALLEISLVVLVEFLRPQELGPELDWSDLFLSESDSAWQALVYNLVWLLSESFVEPFYVAAGFTLYLNRRNDLEGWDIELGFRRLTERMKNPSTAPVGQVVLMAAFIGLSLASFSVPQPAFADAASSADPQAVIQDIVADPVFGRQVDSETWRYRGNDPEEQEPGKFQDQLGEAIENFFRMLAEVFRSLSYGAAVLLAAALLLLLYRNRGRWRNPAPRPRLPPEVRFGLVPTEEVLPDEPADEALRLASLGQSRAALSILYRAALAKLIREGSAELRPGHTEGECLGRIDGRIAPDRQGYLAELIDVWSGAAYGRASPPAERLRGLCMEWPEHFGPSQDSSR